MVRKRVMVIAGIFLVIAVGLLIYGFMLPSEKVITDCLNITPLRDSQVIQKNYEVALSNYETCKTSLKENDKKFKDTTWKYLPTEELYGENGKTPYVNSVEKFMQVKDSLTIMDNLVNNGIVLAKFKAKIYNNELGVKQIFDEMKGIVGEYRSYEQETKVLERLDKEQNTVIKKYFTK